MTFAYTLPQTSLLQLKVNYANYELMIIDYYTRYYLLLLVIPLTYEFVYLIKPRKITSVFLLVISQILLHKFFEL